MKIIKVNDCSDCPYHQLDGNENSDCFIDDKHYGTIVNYPEPNENCPIQYKEPDNEILINNLELASELAENSVIDELCFQEGTEYITEEDLWNGENYKPEAQDVYNRYHAYYIEIIDNQNLLT